MAMQKKECLRILSSLGGDNKQKNSQKMFQEWSWPFWSPIEEVIRNFPSYPDVVKQPMDLDKIKKNVNDKRYTSHREFARDVRLVFANAKLFNENDKDTKGGVYQAAEHCEKQFETEYHQMLASQEEVAPKIKLKLPKQHAAAAAPRQAQFDAAKCRKTMDSLLTKNTNAKNYLWMYTRKQLLELPNYQVVITDPIAGPDIDKNLESGAYSDLAAFCDDVRLFLTNTMRFNLQDCHTDKGTFKLAQDFLQKFERAIGHRAWPGVPKEQRSACNTVLLSLMKHRHDAIYPFLFPMAIYMQAKADLAAYNNVVKRPVDIGAICAALNLGKYTSVDQFYDDMERAFSNCELYWQQPKRREHGRQYCEGAAALRTYFKAECDKQRKSGALPAQSLGSLAAESIQGSVAVAPASSAAASSAASSAAVPSTGASASTKIPCKAPSKGYGRKRKVQPVSAHCLEATRQLKKCSDLVIFLKPVDQKTFTTYKDHVSQPMDLGSIEKRARQGHYNDTDEGLGVEKFATDLQLISDNCRSFAKTLTEIDRAAMYQCAQAMETRAQEQLVNVRKKIHDDAEYKKAEDAERLEQERQRELEQQQRQHYKGRKLSDNELRMLDILDRFAKDKCVTDYHFDIPLDKRRLEDAHRKQLKQKIETPMDLDKIMLKVKRGDYRGPTPFLNFMKDVALITDNAKKLFDDPNKPNEITLREMAVHVDRMFQNFCVDMIPPPSKSDKQLFYRHHTWAKNVVDERQRVVLKAKLRKKHCQQVLKVLTGDENCNKIFGHPLDDTRSCGEEFVSAYKAKIKQPMCLENVKSKLKKDSYDTMGGFYEDVHRIFDNALLFNKDTDPAICDIARKFKIIFEEKWQADSIHALNVIGRQTAENAVDAKERERQRKAREKRQAEEEEHEQEIRRIRMEAQRRDEAAAEEAALHKKQKQVRAQRIAAPTVFKDPAREREERKRAEKEKKRNQEQLKVLCASAILIAAEQVEKSHRVMKRSADAASIQGKPQTKARAFDNFQWQNIQNNAKDTRSQKSCLRMDLVSARKRHKPLSACVFGDELEIPGAPPLKISNDVKCSTTLLPCSEDAPAPSSKRQCFLPGLRAMAHKLFGRYGHEGWKPVAPGDAQAVDFPGGIAMPGFSTFDAGGGMRVEAMAKVVDQPMAVAGEYSPFSSGLLHLSITLCLPAETTAAADGPGVGVVTVQPSTALAPRELHFLESFWSYNNLRNTVGALSDAAATRCPEACSLLQRSPSFTWHKSGVFVSTLRTWSRANDRCAQLHVIGVPGCFRVAVNGIYCCKNCGDAFTAMDMTE